MGVTSLLLGARHTRPEDACAHKLELPLAVACAIAVAACESSAKPSTCHTRRRPRPGRKAHKPRAGGLGFAKCMRSHGVPNFPDPKVVSRSGSSERVYLLGALGTAYKPESHQASGNEDLS